MTCDYPESGSRRKASWSRVQPHAPAEPRGNDAGRTFAGPRLQLHSMLAQDRQCLWSKRLLSEGRRKGHRAGQAHPRLRQRTQGPLLFLSRVRHDPVLGRGGSPGPSRSGSRMFCRPGVSAAAARRLGRASASLGAVPGRPAVLSKRDYGLIRRLNRRVARAIVGTGNPASSGSSPQASEARSGPACVTARFQCQARCFQGASSIAIPPIRRATQL